LPPPPSPPPATRRRLPRLELIALALTAAFAVAYLIIERAPEPGASPGTAPAEAQPRVEERSPPPRSVPPPGRESEPAPGGAPSVPAPPVPGAPELPPTAVSPVPEENPEIPPEAPQTAEWKLEKTERIAGSLGKRVARLEAEVREADARGDREGASARQVLLERSRQRVAELEREIASLREQVRADGGPPP